MKKVEKVLVDMIYMVAEGFHKLAMWITITKSNRK